MIVKIQPNIHSGSFAGRPAIGRRIPDQFSSRNLALYGSARMALRAMM
jgi:hypothetical protein